MRGALFTGYCCSKAVELLAKVYDQVGHAYRRGFSILALGWSDGYSFVPVVFHLLSSAKKSNRYQEASASIDHRTNGYRARKESLLPKPEAAFLMIHKALQAGMDTIGMVKQLKQCYWYQGKFYSVPGLKKRIRYDSAQKIFGSVVVTTKTGFPVKIVVVRNRNKKANASTF